NSLRSAHRLRNATRVAAQDLQPYRGFSIASPLEDAEPASTDLRSLLGVVLRHWKLICILPLVAMAGTSLVMNLVPPQFKSTTEILIVNPKVQIETTMRQTAGLPDTAAMSTQIALVQSKSLALRVVKELELDKEPQFLQHGAIPQLL